MKNLSKEELLLLYSLSSKDINKNIDTINEKLDIKKDGVKELEDEK